MTKTFNMLASRISWGYGATLGARVERSSLRMSGRFLFAIPQSDGLGVVQSSSAYVRRHSTEVEQAQSNRAAFKVLPVDPSILSYIEAIGVGIPKRRPRQRTTKRHPKNSKKKGAVLGSKDEKEFFRQQSQNSGKEPRSRKKPSSESASGPPSWLPPPPFASTPISQGDATDNGHRVRRFPVRVIGSVGAVDDYFPKSKGLPEVALAGRSNVGKSTLLNALLYGNQPNPNSGEPMKRTRTRGRVHEETKLPRGIKAVTSDRPGETRRITFYQLSSDIVFKDEKETASSATMSMLLVDLPGYGFAYASEIKAREWKELMQNYLLHRGKSLKRVLLLIDARHGMKKADIDFLESLESILYSQAQEDIEATGRKTKRANRRDLPAIQLVLTKCDLVAQTDLARRVVMVKEQLSDCLRRQPSSLPVMLVSAKPGVGFNNVRGDRALGGVLELQREIAALAPQPIRV